MGESDQWIRQPLWECVGVSPSLASRTRFPRETAADSCGICVLASRILPLADAVYGMGMAELTLLLFLTLPFASTSESVSSVPWLRSKPNVLVRHE